METLLKTLTAAFAAFGERLSPPVHDTHGRGRAKYVAVREGHKLTAIDPKATKKTHRLDTLESVLAYLGRHGKADETTVFVDRAAIQALLGDVEGGLDLDFIKCPLGESVELRAWKAIAGHKLPHKAFKNIIDDRAGDLAEGFEFLAPGLGMISARSSVSVDHDNSDGDRTSFAVADGAKIGTVALPNRFEISIPLFLAWPKPYVRACGWRTRSTPPTRTRSRWSTSRSRSATLRT